MILEFQNNFRILKILQSTAIELDQLKKLASAEQYNFIIDKTESRCMLHKNKFLPAGLWKKIIELKQLGFEVQFVNLKEFININITKDLISGWVDKQPLPFSIRECQLDGVYTALKYPLCKNEIATGAGKSLILYLLAKYLKEFIINKKTLIVVTSLGLAKQLPKDFKEYFDVDHVTDGNYEDSLTYKSVHSKTSKKELLLDTDVVIGLRQTIQKKPVEYFEQFEAIIFDEAHTVRTKGSQRIIELAQKHNIKFWHGLSGTYEDRNSINGLVTESYIGPTIMNIKPKELMNEGSLTKVKIMSLQMTLSESESYDYYDDDDARDMVTRWRFEQEYIRNLEKPIKIICDVANKLDMNQLMLFNNLESVDTYFEYLTRLTDKKVVKITGNVPITERESIRLEMETRDDMIICATYATMSTGISIKNLHYLHFVESMKSFIAIIQSIGRLLRLHPSKNYATVLDWSIKMLKDGTIQTNQKQNVSYKHALKRIKIYKDYQYDYTIKKINL